MGFRDTFRADGPTGYKAFAEMERKAGVRVEMPLLDEPPLEPVDRWEYKVLNTGYARNTQASKLEDTLNDLGHEGWELVAVVNNPETSMISKHVTQYFLKRRTR